MEPVSCGSSGENDDGDGIENAPKAFIGLFKGENFGKMLVRIGPDPEV